MTIDLENISAENFNDKFKNYLRDFYTFQFKKSNEHFKSSDGKNINKNVTPSTFYNDFKRLRNVLEKQAGIEWIENADNKVNSRIECVTANSRAIARNPFFELYRYCSENSTYPGESFALVYFLMLFFRLGDTVRRRDVRIPESYEFEQLERDIIESALLFEANEKRHAPRKWSVLSDADKQKYADKAISYYIKNEDRKSDLFRYVVLNNKKLVFSDGRVKITDGAYGFVEKSLLYFAFCDYLGKENAIKERHFLNKLDELERIGIIRSQKKGREVSFALSPLFLDGIVKSKELAARFAQMTGFFARTAPLGVIGDYLCERLQSFDSDIYYKHSYLTTALNDYNASDLLYAIKNKKWLWIEHRNAAVTMLEYQSFICFPLQLRESVTGGRQYLLYYHPAYRSVSAVRLDFIDGVSETDFSAPPYFEDDIKRAKELIAHTFGTAFENFEKGNVKEPLKTKEIVTVIKFQDGEEFIKRRIYRELRGCVTDVDESIDGQIRITAQAVSVSEIESWLRSYITRVVSFTVDKEEYEPFKSSVYKTYLQYSLPFEAEDEAEDIFSKSRINLLENPPDKSEKCGMHSLIFCDLYSTAFTKLGEILVEMIRLGKADEKTVSAYRKKYANIFNFETASRRNRQFDGFISPAICKDGLTPKSKFVFTEKANFESVYQLLPLTKIELQWLSGILENPLARCFLTEDEIEDIKAVLPKQELFDINDLLQYDRFSDGDADVKNSDYGENMQKLLSAIRREKKISIEYLPISKKSFKISVSPAFAEYSKQDGRFRLVAVTDDKKVFTFNVERIISLSVTDSDFCKKDTLNTAKAFSKENEAALEIIINESKNVPDRILNEFAPWQKRCVKREDGRYKLTLIYDKNDVRELVIRLLKYGQYVYVENDDTDLKQILLDKLESQIRIFENTREQTNEL